VLYFSAENVGKTVLRWHPWRLVALARTVYIGRTHPTNSWRNQYGKCTHAHGLSIRR